MSGSGAATRIDAELARLVASGQYKYLRHVTGPMGPVVRIEGHGEVVMLCSNDYLGLAAHPDVVRAGIAGLERYGTGTASVRFITGTLDVHRTLESSIADLVGTPAALTYSSAWTANEAVFPTLAAPGDVIISDELNHASIIDSIRQVHGARRAIFPHGDLKIVEQLLGEHREAAARWVVTDGVFSMEGDVADLAQLVRMCGEYDAMLVVDDAHGVGVLGVMGRGTPEHADVFGQVDVVTGTLGKALGGAAGGYVGASQRVVDLLTQRSRPALFSNALPGAVACASHAAIDVLRREPERVQRLRDNVESLRVGLRRLGFDVRATPSAMIPIIVGETADAIAKSKRLLELGVMVVGFGYPVVPRGEARLRIQGSAGLEDDHIERALSAFSRL